jgi:hypothetical protein
VRKTGLGLYQIDQSLPSSFTATWLRVATPDAVMAVRLLTTLGWVAIAPQLLFGLIRSSGKRVALVQPA